MTTDPKLIEKVDKILCEHGLRYKAKNPIEHPNLEPDCGMCHHIDVLSLKHGLAYILHQHGEEVRRKTVEECASLLTKGYEPYHNEHCKEEPCIACSWAKSIRRLLEEK